MRADDDSGSRISRIPPARLPWQVEGPLGVITEISVTPSKVVFGEASAPATDEAAGLPAEHDQHIQGEEPIPKHGGSACVRVHTSATNISFC